MKKTAAAVSVFLILLLVLSPFSAFAYDFDLNGYAPGAASSFVVNTDTGRVVFDNGGDVRRSIASLTKIMTAVVVLENCGELRQTVTVKRALIDEIEETGLVTAGLAAGETIPVEELLYCLLVSSTADAALVLADFIGGSVDAFVAMMNEKAAYLGMTDTNYIDPHGLHNLADGNYSTAKDQAVLCMYALKNATFATVVSTAKHTVPATNLSGPRTLEATNYLMLDGNACRYDRAIGIKTGYTKDAGRCLAAAATNGSETYVSVVLGCEAYKPDGSIEVRHFKDSIWLLETAFRNYAFKTALLGDEVLATVHDRCFGIDDDVPLVPGTGFSWLLRGDEEFRIQTTLLRDSLSEPVEKGTKLGECRISAGGIELGTVDLVAGATVERSVKRMAATVLIIALIAIAALIFPILIFRLIFGKKRRRKKRRHTAGYRR